MFKDWQKGQVFIYILKKWVKALEYKALTHFLPTFLSTMPFYSKQAVKFPCCFANYGSESCLKKKEAKRKKRKEKMKVKIKMRLRLRIRLRIKRCLF
ncbi:hypothetical protein [Actinobacillus ureae]|uniref:hypothetical protein n=1 Tax=Actinobacillus ureae TaxID=723 RepID=UPI000E20A029|nr:hypothetical protein [Actinobacillus ureae]